MSPLNWNKVFRKVSRCSTTVLTTIINTLMHHKMVDFIDCARTKHISHLFFSLFPTVSPCGSLSLTLSRCFSFWHYPPPPPPSVPVSFNVNLSLVPPPPLSRSPVMADHSLAVSGENIVDPGHQRADFGVNARVVRLSAALTPRDNTLQLAVTHQRTTGVTLSRGEEEEKNLFPPSSHPIKYFFYMSTDH